MYIYIYIYIYIFMDVCLGVFACCGLPAKLSPLSLKRPGCLENLPLSMSMRKSHKDLRDRKKTMKDVGQLGARLRSRESKIQTQDAGLVSRLYYVGLELSEGGMESRTKTQRSEDDDLMNQHLWYLCRIFAEFLR